MGDDGFVGKEYNGKELAERIERFRDEMIEIIREADNKYSEYYHIGLRQESPAVAERIHFEERHYLRNLFFDFAGKFYKIFPEFKPERRDEEGAD